MKYIKLFENFQDYDPYELMIIPPNLKTQMIIREINKSESNMDLINDLIMMGANLDWIDPDTNGVGWGALHWCVSRSKPEIAKILIEAGADVNIQDNDEQETPLQKCAASGREEIAKMLIDAEADVNMQDKLNSTALHFCAYYSQAEIARMLIGAGADKTISNIDGKIPYEYAETEELKELLQP